MQGDFFAIELHEGNLFVHLNLGSGGIKVQITIRRVDDGIWHEVTLNRHDRTGLVTVDEVTHDFTLTGKLYDTKLLYNLIK